MSDPDWQRIQDLFHAVLALHPERREAFLEQACASDRDLRSEVRALLAAHDEDDGALEGPLGLDAPYLNDFEIIEELGAGSMGVVYRAWQYSLRRTVAIKTLPRAHAREPGLVDRFRREAQAMAKLNHPAIVRVHAVGDEGSTHYFVMEYVQGRDLARELDQLRKPATETSYLPPFRSAAYITAAARLCATIADALESAHAAGIVHRDVKPHNILLTADGTPRVSDFGLARDASLDSLTKGRGPAGTPYYMSPEQARTEDPAHRVDHRTDVYSLGVVLYELLTLRRPFEGETSVEVMRKIETRLALPIRDVNPRVPRDLATICGKAMRKDKRRRYATARAFADDLERFLAHEAPTATPMSWGERARDLGARRPVPAALAAAIVAAAVALAGGRVWSAYSDERARRDAVAEIPTPEELADFEWTWPPIDRRLEEELAELGEVLEAIDRIEERWGTGDRSLEVRRFSIKEHARVLANSAIADLSAHFHPDGATAAHAPVELCFDLAVEAGRIGGTPRLDLGPMLGAAVATVDITTVPAGAEVHAHPLDRFTGLPLDAVAFDLGRTPLDGAFLRPGYYRFVATANDGRVGEHVALIDERGRRYELPTLYARRTEDLLDGMVRIGTGPFEGDPIDPPNAFPILKGTVELSGFLIDRTEVTNGAYRRFCEATGHPFPDAWPAEWRSKWNGLPVTFIDVFDAEAYCAWAGKRLPTYAEWARAVRGARLAPYPWGTEPSSSDGIAALANVWVAGIDTGDAGSRWAAYLAGVRPAGGSPGDVSPDGVLDGFGNLAEWTASPSFHQTLDDAWVIDPGQRFVLGFGWSFPPRPLNHRQPVAKQSTDNGISFRCARTLTD